MWQTLSLICREQKDFDSLLSVGFKIKQTNNLQYLIKQEDII